MISAPIRSWCVLWSLVCSIWSILFQIVDFKPTYFQHARLTNVPQFASHRLLYTLVFNIIESSWNALLIIILSQCAMRKLFGCQRSSRSMKNFWICILLGVKVRVRTLAYLQYFSEYETWLQCFQIRGADSSKTCVFRFPERSWSWFHTVNEKHVVTS